MPTKVYLATSQEELEELFRFRYKVYIEDEGLSPCGVNHESKVFSDELDKYSQSWYLSSGNEIVGSLRMTFLDSLPDISLLKGKFNFAPALKAFGRHQICTTSRFVLSPTVSGRSAFNLMKEGALYGVERGLKLNYGDCSPHMIPFYRKLGYMIYTKAYNDPAYGYKFPIVMLFRDTDWLEKIGSPLRHLDMEPTREARDWFDLNYPEYSRSQNLYIESPTDYLEDLRRITSVSLHRQLKVLGDMTNEETASLLYRSAVIDCEVGDIVIRPDLQDDTVYMVITGKYKASAPGSRTKIMRSGESFSSSSRFFHVGLSKHVQVHEKGKLLVLGRGAINYLELIKPRFAENLLLGVRPVIDSLF